MSTTTTRRRDSGAKVIPLHRARHTAAPKRGYVRLSDEQRVRTTRELVALKVAGRLDAAAYAAISARTGASKRTLEGLLAAALRNAAAGGEPLPDPRTARTSKLDISDEVLLCHVGRDLTNAHMLAIAQGLIPPCHRTTYRDAVLKELSANELNGLRLGQRVLPQQWVYLDRRENPLMDQFTIDLFFPRVRTTLADGTTAVPVWVSVRERSRGLLLAWGLFHRTPRDDFDVEGDPASGPTAATVLALLGEAIRGWTRDGVFCGGLPRALRCDREALFLTEELRTLLMTLGIEVDPTNSYSSWENGAHERMHQVIRREALQGLPASNEGPRTRSGKLRFAEATMSFDELAARLDRWALSYNFERANPAVGGLTPFASWCERIDAGDTVERASNRELAALSLPTGKTATKQRNGITVPGGGLTYSGPALVGVRNGTVFALGTWVGDDRHLEIFDPTTGAYVATLERTSDMSGATEGAIMRTRARQRETVETILAEAARRHRIEHGATPARPTPADELTPADDADELGADCAAEGGAAADDRHEAPAVGRHAVPANAAPDAPEEAVGQAESSPSLSIAPQSSASGVSFAARLAAAEAHQRAAAPQTAADAP
ncbi:Integrase core domain-containing protein [Blastococcus aggregatus]|uniref:Integrase core domain-containing protein n=1 Tax=Blastococcus aggregatus TaxID=38502 RepID=A0A285UZG3_9ACTN|nr:DDE-type integrase/transposase/recombinase [Blastococcus aggregatus]SOC47219.1 Integrase core domain-containing protein [Blastococcus aggregatus]